MANRSHEAKRPASPNEDATPPAGPQLKLRDGALSVSVFEKTRDKGGSYRFIVPERVYRDKDDEWVNTHVLHEEHLLSMAFLLVRTYAKLRQSTDESAKGSN